ncbi:hypothetical protein ACF1FC_18750 [Streptomyces sp. NPDC014344]|uniref:hypothetical protein n=1 Tax=Streptomyces sp. NPDC014344 TaxID=3364871 RepID=UPI0036FCE3C3
MTHTPWSSPHAPTPSSGPLPPAGWIDHVGTDPALALEMLVPGWYPAEETEPDPKALADGELARLPPALAAFRRLARLRPTPHRFSNPALLRPRHVRRPHGGQLVFAADNQGVRDWSIPWPLRDGPTDSGHPLAHVVGEVVEGLPLFPSLSGPPGPRRSGRE